MGSRTLSRLLPQKLSPATIRNVMADLTDAGLLFAPHTSAGRLPTDRGLRLFVDGLLQFGELVGGGARPPSTWPWRSPGARCRTHLAQASSMLSGLSAAAGMVLAPKGDGPLKHIEFVPLSPGRALVVLVSADGQVENRIIETPAGAAAQRAAAGRQLSECAALGALAGGIAPQRGHRKSPPTAPRSMS